MRGKITNKEVGKMRTKEVLYSLGLISATLILAAFILFLIVVSSLASGAPLTLEAQTPASELISAPLMFVGLE
jgi:hypothetical protein